MDSSIFEGRVRHVRHAPVTHEFSYKVFLLYLDLDELDTVFSGRWLWSTRRTALARFRRDDHLGDPDLPLRESVAALVEQRTGSAGRAHTASDPSQLFRLLF